MKPLVTWPRMKEELLQKNNYVVPKISNVLYSEIYMLYTL